ncbi:transcriptional regulator NrdR [Sinimarinibacterium sp. NLF-5-8]|uniref:transcriptional regulator NrdR n=1 Tax=Sinimarinibacterium sp. NLF-5-8 TaxID=2698684 RepID=UPI00137BB52D|nr:transcriptional regulator NrdR [Sinimarinibacterium sp. NLF-5-8]QHS09895.1 transcriptional repressor NrdR [Sinimarinibacterium sp. NLF-5-8]
MQCPFCKAPDTRVVDSRLAEDGTQVRRRRECEKCGARFTTFERALLPMPNILKRSGDAAAFSEEKLRQGMKIALYKRAVTAEQIEHAMDRIKRKLRACGDRDVPSRELGEWVMDELRELDHVGYVRFASIYRSFEDVNAFRDEIEKLQSRTSSEAQQAQLSLLDDAEPSA